MRLVVVRAGAPRVRYFHWIGLPTLSPRYLHDHDCPRLHTSCNHDGLLAHVQGCSGIDPLVP